MTLAFRNNNFFAPLITWEDSSELIWGMARQMVMNMAGKIGNWSRLFDLPVPFLGAVKTQGAEKTDPQPFAWDELFRH